MKLFSDVLKKNRGAVFIFLIISAVNTALFFLYGIMKEALLYSVAVGLFFLCAVIISDFLKEKKRAGERAKCIASVKTDPFNLPSPETAAEEDLSGMIRILGAALQDTVADFDTERQRTKDYYTDWVHEIKTPIAVLKLKLSEDTPENREMSRELFRIEEYVNAVMQYARLESGVNDLVIGEYSVDEMIREAVKKFAPQFIEKKLRLEYTPTDKTAVTDKKHFTAIIEQILSNAVKYTDAGAVSVKEEDGYIVISDTGIGIPKEDLPRIFERGYTGENGRSGSKSSGIGLYLAKKAADLLSVSLSVESEKGKGTVFRLQTQKNDSLSLK